LGVSTEAKEVLGDFEKQAREAGLTEVKQVIEFGNPKTLLAHDIPDKEEVDLIMVGATGLNTFERLLIGSSSEYILRHAKVDLLVVREHDKTL
ncbi:universal stress protein, partial [Streptococcus equi]